jgi:hypothetical protein
MGRRASVKHKGVLPTFLYTILSKKKPNVSDQEPEVKGRLVWCGVGRGATFLKAARGGGGLMLSRFISLESLLPELITNNSHIALGGVKGEK